MCINILTLDYTYPFVRFYIKNLIQVMLNKKPMDLNDHMSFGFRILKSVSDFINFDLLIYEKYLIL